MTRHHRLTPHLRGTGCLIALLLSTGPAWAQNPKSLQNRCNDVVSTPVALEGSFCKAPFDLEKALARLNESAYSAPAVPSLSVSSPEAILENHQGLPAESTLTADGDSTIDIDPELIESSPVLQRWIEEIPDVATDIRHDPAFRTRLRLGYAHFPSNDHTGGLQVGVQDLFVGRTPLTLSAEYSQNGRGDRTSYGFDAQYYVLPLGSYGNFAPILGYRHLETTTYSREGINVGFRVVLIPSRTGAADVSLTQSWVAPGTNEEVGLTTFSVGYAVTSQLRISTDIQTQNTAIRQDSRVGIVLEWML